MPHPRIAERERVGMHQIKNTKKLSLNGRIAVFLTNHFGTMGMFYVLVVWTVLWIGFAASGMSLLRFDPYPFTFYLFLSNLIQLYALPILAVGQQVLSQASDKQAEQTYKDAEAILRLQDEVHRLIKINNELTEEIHRTLLKK